MTNPDPSGIKLAILRETVVTLERLVKNLEEQRDLYRELAEATLKVVAAGAATPDRSTIRICIDMLEGRECTCANTLSTLLFEPWSHEDDGGIPGTGSSGGGAEGDQEAGAAPEGG